MVHPVRDGEGFKYYQNVYNKAFLPGGFLRFFREGAGPKPKMVEKFISQFTGAYKPQDFFVMEEMKDYDPSENPVSSDDPVLTQEGPDY
jgi:hypothetical protein